MIVVTAATGNVGKPLVEALAAAGEEVVSVSRRPLDHPPGGVRHVQADLSEPETLRPALEGADVVFLVLAGDVAAEGDAGALLDVVKTSGVRRVVLLSSQVAGTRPQAQSHAAFRQFEAAVHGSGLDWTVLRPGGFASNAFAYVPSIREGRAMSAPFADTGLPLVDPRDIAEAAAVVLRDPGHAGRTYQLTGPALVTPREQARAIGAAIGEEIAFTELTRDQAAAYMAQFMPEPLVAGTLDILGAPTADEQRVSADVPDLLGRPARSFDTWAADHAVAFR